MGPLAIGLDVGGSKVAGGVVDAGTGEIFLGRREPTARGGEAQLDQALGMAQALLADARARGLAPRTLGLGVAELVGPEGDVLSGHRIAWKGLPVRERLSEILSARVEADVRAAALAEARLGAARPFAHALYVTVGTGISAALIQGGIPYAGARGAALVIANARTRALCPACGAVHDEVLEDLAGGAALARLTGSASAQEALARAEAGDARAAEVVDEGARLLGERLAVLAGALDPEALILGGGLGSAPGRYARGVEAAFRAALWDGDDAPPPLLRAALGAEAGVVGAALAGLAGWDDKMAGPMGPGRETPAEAHREDERC